MPRKFQQPGWKRSAVHVMTFDPFRNNLDDIWDMEKFGTKKKNKPPSAGEDAGQQQVVTSVQVVNDQWKQILPPQKPNMTG